MTIGSTQPKSAAAFLTVLPTRRSSAGVPFRPRKSCNGWKTRIAFSPSRSLRLHARFRNAFDKAIYSLIIVKTIDGRFGLSYTR